MAFLTVAGTPIPVSIDSGNPDIEETGSRERMFDASMVEAIRVRKRTVPCSTPFTTRAIAETYVTAVTPAAPPVSCSGDVFNNVATNCFIQYRGMSSTGSGSGTKWRVHFTLFEA